jgi:hypothetical protein
VAVVVLLNMVLGPHPLERRTQHLPDDDLSVREQIVTTKQRDIVGEEVAISVMISLNRSAQILARTAGSTGPSMCLVSNNSR